MKPRVIYRRFRPGVTFAAYVAAIPEGRAGELVEQLPSELDLLAYGLWRDAEAGLGAPADVVEGVAFDVEAARARGAEWAREWPLATPCDRNGDPLEPEAPVSPLERRRLHPRRRAGAR